MTQGIILAIIPFMIYSMEDFEIVYYKTETGKVPVLEFLKSLDEKNQAKAIDSLRLLERYGNKLEMPHSKPLGKGLFELRIKFRNDISRVFYFFFLENKIVVTNGFIKKTMKTPRKEIEKARKYKKDWEERKHV